MATVVQLKFPPFTPHQGQEAFLKSLKPEIAYVGGVGAGKSLVLCARAILLAHQLPGNKGLITRKTYKSLNETTRTTFMSLLPPDMYAGEQRKEDELYINAAGGGRSTIFWRSFEDSPADWQKFRSADYGFIAIDEASEAPRGLVDILASRLRTPVSYRSLFHASNPTPKEHWLYEYFLGKKADPKLRELFRGSTYENRANLPAGYIEYLEQTYSPDQIDIILKGEFGHIPAGLPVFESFKRMTDGRPWHVRNGLQPVPGLPIIRGWDFGVVRPAVVWMQWGQQKRVLREKLGYNLSTPAFGRHIKELSAEMFPGFTFADYCDPQGFARQENDAKASVDHLKPLGIIPLRIRKTNPGKRAEIIDECLRRTITTENGIEPEFVIDDTCETLIGALAGGYRRPEIIPDAPIGEDPVKDGYFEHLVDALGFIFAGRLMMGESDTSRRRLNIDRQRQRASSYQRESESGATNKQSRDRRMGSRLQERV